MAAASCLLRATMTPPTVRVLRREPRETVADQYSSIYSKKMELNYFAVWYVRCCCWKKRGSLYKQWPQVIRGKKKFEPS
jgi:hypothetical protein